MATTLMPAPFPTPVEVVEASSPSGFAATLHDWVVTVDHKRLGIMYVVTGLVFLVIGGIEASFMRLRLAPPRPTPLSPPTVYTPVTPPCDTIGFPVGSASVLLLSPSIGPV